MTFRLAVISIVVTKYTMKRPLKPPSRTRRLGIRKRRLAFCSKRCFLEWTLRKCTLDFVIFESCYIHQYYNIGEIFSLPVTISFNSFQNIIIRYCQLILIYALYKFVLHYIRRCLTTEVIEDKIDNILHWCGIRYIHCD